MKPVLVGEANPYGSVEHALFPDPPGGSGWRLCHHVMGLEEATYLELFDRVNLFRSPPDSWSVPEARVASEKLLKQFGERVYILLGKKVAAAFGMEGLYEKVKTKQGSNLLSIPHPSGLSRYSSPAAARESRQFLRRFLEFPFGEADRDDLEAEGLRREKEWRKAHRAERLDVSSGLAVHVLLGLGDPEGGGFVRVPGQDHARLYRLAERWLCVVYHPYVLNKALREFCKTWGLHGHVHTRSSYNPGGTLCVELMKEEDYWAWTEHLGDIWT